MTNDEIILLVLAGLCFSVAIGLIVWLLKLLKSEYRQTSSLKEAHAVQMALEKKRQAQFIKESEENEKRIEDGKRRILDEKPLSNDEMIRTYLRMIAKSDDPSMLFSLSRAISEQNHEIVNMDKLKTQIIQIRTLDRFRKTKHYELIVAFVLKYVQTWPEFELDRIQRSLEREEQRRENQPIGYEPPPRPPDTSIDHLFRLQELLRQRNWNFSIQEIAQIVISEENERRIDDGRRRILLGNPQGREGIIRAFLRIANSNDEQMMHSLIRALRETGNESANMPELKTEIVRIEKKDASQRFERSLLGDIEEKLPPNIDTLSGHEFEVFVSSLFQKMGFVVEHTKLSGDQGADVVLSRLGEKTVIQVKRSSSRVGNKAVQQVLGSISLYKAEKGMVVSNNFYTRSAVSLATANRIELVDRDQLLQLIKMYW